MSKTINQLNEEIYNEIINDYKTNGMKHIWTMKNGDEISLCDMKDSHVQNCKNMLLKLEQTSGRKAWIEIFSDVILRRRERKINKIKSRILQKSIKIN